MKKLILLFSLASFIKANTQTTQQEPFVLGEIITLSSEILNEERILNVYLPTGYEKATKKYPVIYVLDGSADEDFIHIVGLVQFCSFSWIQIIEESIVVGIANVDRKRDFTFPTTNTKDKEDFPTTGGSEKFIQFIEQELQPFVSTNYKATSQRTIIGQSLGGLLATEILLKKPNLFDNYIITSPSVWWDDESLLALKPELPITSKKIYISVGSEGPTMETGAIDLRYKLMLAYKDNQDISVFFKLLEKQNHGDALHLSVYDAFEKMSLKN